MGLCYNVYLNAQRIYGCKNCKTHLADHNEIISRVSLAPPFLAPPFSSSDSASSSAIFTSIGHHHHYHPHHSCNTHANPLLLTPRRRLLPPTLELPRSTWQSLPLQQRRQHPARRSWRAEYDDGPPRRPGHLVSTVQRHCGMEIRPCL